MMNEPQRLDYQTNKTNNPSVVVHFVDYSVPINLCLQKVGTYMESTAEIMLLRNHFVTETGVQSVPSDYRSYIFRQSKLPFVP